MSFSYNKQPLPSQVKIDSYNLQSKGIILWYIFNENGGLDVYDYSGFGNDAVLTNMAVTDWEFSDNERIEGYALDFKAGTRHLDGPNDGIINTPETEMSLSVWVNIDSFAATRYIVAKGLNSSTWETYRLRIETNGEANFSVQNDGLSQFPAWESPISISTGEWHHFVFILHEFSASESDVTGYLDGIELNLDFTANGYNGSFTALDYSSAANATFRVGSGHSGSSTFNPLDGKIGSVCIHDRALAPNEPMELFRKPFGMILEEEIVGFVPSVAGGTILPQVVSTYYRVNS